VRRTCNSLCWNMMPARSKSCFSIPLDAGALLSQSDQVAEPSPRAHSLPSPLRKWRSRLLRLRKRLPPLPWRLMWEAIRDPLWRKPRLSAKPSRLFSLSGLPCSTSFLLALPGLPTPVKETASCTPSVRACQENGTNLR
jgi:hypothetical protein